MGKHEIARVTGCALLLLSCTAVPTGAGKRLPPVGQRSWPTYEPIDLHVEAQKSERFDLACIQQGLPKKAYALPILFTVDGEKAYRYFLRYEKGSVIGFGYYKTKPKDNMPCRGIIDELNKSRSEAEIVEDWVELAGKIFFDASFSHVLHTAHCTLRHPAHSRSQETTSAAPAFSKDL